MILKYVGDYLVIAIKGNQVEVRPSIGGPSEMKHIKHVKYIHPVERYIKHVPDYSTFGCKTTLRMNPKHITDLHWQLEESLHTTNIGQTIQVCTLQCGCEHLKLHWKKEYIIPREPTYMWIQQL